MSFLRKRWWIILGLSIAFIIQVTYDFLGEPIFTNIMPKEWWGLMIGLALGLWLFFEGRRIHSKADPLNTVRMHLLCLLTNERLILSTKEMDHIRSHISSVLSDVKPAWGDDSKKAWTVWERGVKDKIVSNMKNLENSYRDESILLKKKLGELLESSDKLQAYLGYYHSRIILSIDTPAMTIEGLEDIRQIRKILCDSIMPILNDFLNKMKDSPPSHPVHYIRCYPLIEIGEEMFARVRREELKEDQRQYGFESTCFYYDTPDVGRAQFLAVRTAKVQMRVSGAKLILSKISDQLFWNLVNLIYYHGLYSYKPSRTKGKKDEAITFYLDDQLLAKMASVIHEEFCELGNTLLMRRYTTTALGLSVVSIIIAVLVATIKFLTSL